MTRTTSGGETCRSECGGRKTGNWFSRYKLVVKMLYLFVVLERENRDSCVRSLIDCSGLKVLVGCRKIV